MSDDEIIAFLAEFRGFRNLRRGSVSDGVYGEYVREDVLVGDIDWSDRNWHAKGIHPNTGVEVPDFLESLDAVFDLEVLVEGDLDLQHCYGEALANRQGLKGPRGGSFNLNGFGFFSAAHIGARVRCEALVAAIQEVRARRS